MRIEENFDDGSERAADRLQQSAQIAELKGLLEKIRAFSGELRTLFLTEEERREMYGLTEDFDKRMQAEVQNVTCNLETYYKYRWKELLCEGEDGDD